MAKMTFNVSLEEFGKKAAEYALDEITYNDLTIRQWVEKIASGEFQPVRYATAIYIPNSKGYPSCSCCHEEMPFFLNFCPCCGAKIDGGASDA